MRVRVRTGAYVHKRAAKGRNVMTENKGRTVRSVYGICLSVLTAVVGVLFIVQVWSIFRSAEQDPFTVERISAHFAQIAVPVWLWVAAVIGGGVLSYVFPEEEAKLKAYADVGKTLRRLKTRLPEDTEGMAEVNKENRIRKTVWIVAAALCVISAVVALVYLFDLEYTATFNTEFYQSHPEAEKFVKIFPWLLASLCVCAGASVYEAYSVKKEIGQVKALIAESAKKGIKAAPKAEKPSLTDKLYAKFSFLRSEKFLLGVRIGLCAVGVVFVIVGIFNGGMKDVLTKAIEICTQCIGLG